MVTSMLPPETKASYFFPLTSTLLNNAAATATAPAPSAINFAVQLTSKLL